MYQVCTGDCPIRVGVFHPTPGKDHWMKLLADENIPSSVVRALVDGGYDIVWIRTKAPGISDLDVMRYACLEKRILLTYDKDFGELAVKDNLCPIEGIILFRLYLKNPVLTGRAISRLLKRREYG